MEREKRKDLSISSFAHENLEQKQITGHMHTWLKNYITLQ